MVMDKTNTVVDVDRWLIAHGWVHREYEDAWVYRDDVGGIIVPDILLDSVDDPIARVEAMMAERRAKIAQGGEEAEDADGSEPLS